MVFVPENPGGCALTLAITPAAHAVAHPVAHPQAQPEVNLEHNHDEMELHHEVEVEQPLVERKVAETAIPKKSSVPAPNTGRVLRSRGKGV